MKKTINLLKDRNFQTVIAGSLVVGVGMIMMLEGMSNHGIQTGGDQIIKIAEKMTPGFTEQFQKFVYSKKLGWKN